MKTSVTKKHRAGARFTSPILRAGPRPEEPIRIQAAALAFATGARYRNARATGNVSVDRVNADYFFFLDFLAFFFMAFFFAFGMSQLL
jgi:hypothetical protein